MVLFGPCHFGSLTKMNPTEFTCKEHGTQETIYSEYQAYLQVNNNNLHR
jgi:hypothetical protein